MSYLSNPNSLTEGPFGTAAASHNTGFFTDNTNPASTNCNVLPSPSSNIVAASGKWTGGKRKKRFNKKRTSNRGGKKTKRSRRRKRSRGGTTNNVPNTPTYATGTELPYNLSALANPAPYWTLNNSTNCMDNYNHYTGGKIQTKRKKQRQKTRRKRRTRRGG